MKTRFLLLLCLLASLSTLPPPLAAQEGSPPTEAIALTGLDAPVEVYFDTFGVPHIYASSPHDLMMAQGYLHAQDRWWQMEWFRRTGAGRTAELLGTVQTERDLLIRQWGLPRNAQRDLDNLSVEERALLQAYADGVNAYLAGKSPREVADEYEILAQMGHEVSEIEAWEPLDTMLWAQVMAFNMSGRGLTVELIRAAIMEEAGLLGLRLLIPDYPYDTQPLIMEPGAAAIGGWPARDAASLPASIAALDPLPDSFWHAGGSNNWVISGDLSATGKPFLANDPHISTMMPGIWYENGLHCAPVSTTCPYDLLGFTFAGSPLIVIGHNQHLGWGMTNVGADVIDTFSLELNPDNPQQYRLDGAWVEMTPRREVIEVWGEEAFSVELWESVFGPVTFNEDGSAYALRWAAAVAPLRSFQALHLAALARNWEEFQQAMRFFDVPGQNLVYADVEGNIGYVMTGRIPIRAAGQDGTVPTDGTASANNWQGFIDPLENPRLFNPAAGYIISANNAVIRPEDFPHKIADVWSYGSRAARLQQLMEASPQHDLQSIMAMQTDNYHNAAPWVIPTLREISADDPLLADFAAWLGEWDFQNDADSPQAALFNVFWRHLMLLGLDELPVYEVSHSTYLLSQIWESPNHPLWRHAEQGNTSRDAILRQAFQAAIEEMSLRMTEDRNLWRWGELHQAFHQNNLLVALAGAVPPSLAPHWEGWNQWLNRSAPVGGWGDAANATDWEVVNENYFVTSLPSMRLIIDFSDFDQSQSVIPVGQSGDPASPHYSDQLALWAAESYHTQPFTRPAVEASAIRSLRFVP